MADTKSQAPKTEADNIALFDRKAVSRARLRSQPHLDNHGFLIDWAGDQLLDRLNDIKREFPKALQIGLRNNEAFKQALQNRNGTQSLFQMDIAPLSHDQIIAEEDMLPFAPASLDMIISTFALHSVNDLPGALLQMRRALKPDGLFIGAMLGGETLFELRHCLMEAELALTDGISPRVAPMADKQDMGALMQRAGFALPVIDSDILTVTYDHVFTLMDDLRRMGENNAITKRLKKIPPRQLFAEAGRIYADKFSEDDGKIRASFEIIFVIGWAPHESQQQPLKPGSAEHSLADALAAKTTGKDTL